MTLPALDLAFAVADPLPPELLSRADGLADPLAGGRSWERTLARWLQALSAELPEELRAPAYSLGLTLTDDATIAGLNAQWRQKSGPTDVLAFAALEEAPPLPPSADRDEAVDPEPLELGDVVISLETAARQAEETGLGLGQELLFLASHGLLHLLGWDHPDEAALAAMLERQERLLAGAGERA
ncbi:rRNA maturation RNase YbeY [Cyanobium sp. FGCU-6]|jgi:probable rRNA maturation factor|nr:rRNA maturation RNase YbeY [Cyanobium sp. FGCU6]